MRWIPWSIALIAAVFGGWILQEQESNRMILRVDRIFQDWLIDLSGIPVRLPIPVTLVEMEDADNWTALDYSLFLKALPTEHPPVVILESLPAEGSSAFHRAFHDQAIKQPGLILPVLLSTQGRDAADNPWWLGGWKSQDQPRGMTHFHRIESGPPEILRGTVAAGVVNLPVQNLEEAPGAALYFLLNDDYVPSLTLRAILSAWKIAPSQVRIQSGIFLAGRRLLTDRAGVVQVDVAFLPGMRRLASSDLLLRLNQDTALGAPGGGVSSELLQGVLVLGNLSEKTRIGSGEKGVGISRPEIIAAAIATICNGPILAPPPLKYDLLLLLILALVPSFLARFPIRFMYSAVPVLASTYLIVSIWLATKYSIALSLFMPFCVLFMGFSLNHLAANFRSKHG